METIVYAGHLALKTVEDLKNYLHMFNSNVKLHPLPHHRIHDIKGSLSQIDVDRALQETGLHYAFDGTHYHLLKR
ncbi:hypothetical protein [Catalinimonas niigatensis]|uniref:hypothetical protein n=1 Tax=Catalinimonas niigatensis TaxID=1397264 RepID=UPI002666774A|nr:hypothetical protein [Catalinimonas niigatensis]WPP49812.1 hypothetical protein PZB72_24375 [Catalinimonas niigatensis]